MDKNDDMMDFQTMLGKMKKLYEYYCQYGERLNVDILKSHKFIKISKEAGLMDQIINRTRLEIIYKSENKYNRMNFEQFLNSLMKIADLKYRDIHFNEDPTQDLKEKVVKLINEYYLPLYIDIFTNEQNENMLNIENFENIDNILYTDIGEEILTNIAPILFEIYRVYFSHEISISENESYIRENSLKQYFIFLKDFEVSPGLVSKPLAYQVFLSETDNDESSNSITNNKDFYFRTSKKIDPENFAKYDTSNHNILGQFFIFFKFVRALFKLSQLTFQKVEFKSFSPYEKIIMFFQKFELSEGFSNFQLKNNKTLSEKESNIIKPELIDFINAYIEENENILNTETNNNQQNEAEKNTLNDNNQQQGSSIQNRNENLLYSDNYEPEFSNYINEVYGEDLLRIFKGLCSCGDPFNYKFMKSEKFYKCLLESGLVKVNSKTNFGLEMNEIDTLFIKLYILNRNINKTVAELISSTNSNSNNGTSVSQMESRVITLKINKKETLAKIEFEYFLVGIEIIAKVIYSELPEKDAIDKIVTEHLFQFLKPIYNQKIKLIEDKVENLKQLQSQEDYIEVLKIAHKAMTPIFKYYTKTTKNLMTFHQFIQFAKDFEIFPGIISKVKLNAFFGALALYATNNEEELMIEQSLFIDILALCSNEIIYPEPEPSPVEKVLILMEKIGQSEGMERITIKTGNNRVMTHDTFNILEEFQNAYPEYFGKKDPKKQTFMELMSS